ncbi:unnamed protein product [Agarophyton chilense]
MGKCPSWYLHSYKTALSILLAAAVHFKQALATQKANIFIDAQHRQDPLVQAVTLTTFNVLHLTPFKPQTVFHKGYLLSKWKSCSQQAKPKACITLPIHQDRIAFLYTYKKERHAEYRLKSPQVSSRTNRSDSSVTTYRHAFGKAWFTLLFRCRRNTIQQWNEVFDLTVPITDHYSIQTTLIKRCASGVSHPFLQVGFIQNDQLRLWDHNELDAIRVSASTAVTPLIIRLKNPAWALQHGKPSMKTTKQLLSISTRGVSSNGTFLQGDNKMWLLYTCHQSGVASAYLKIDLGPWKALTMHFNKSCGGSVANGLNIGTTRKFKDVIDNGITQPSFVLTPGNETSLQTLPASKRSLTVSVSNNGLDTLNMGRAHITLHNASVLEVRIRNWDTMALYHGHRRPLRLETKCKRNGTAVIQVSIPVLQHQAAEFWVRKLCAPLGKERTMVTTAAMLTVGVVVSLSAQRIWRKREVRGYRLVPLSS